MVSEGTPPRSSHKNQVSSQTLHEATFNISDLVSVIIPCFNDGQYLREALDSVRSTPDSASYEIIVVNDGSSDAGTLTILSEIEKAGCCVLHQPNRGLGAARNAGIKIAKGSYILPLDSDNRIRAKYILEGARLLSANARLGVVYGDAEYFGNRSGRWTVPEFSLSELIRSNFIDACAVFRKQAWEEVGGYDEEMPFMGWEDWDLWMRIALRNWGFYHVKEVLFEYRVRSNSMISRTVTKSNQLHEYIFSKESLTDAKIIRNRQNEVEKLLRLEGSSEYRLGSAIIRPLRKVKHFFIGRKH